MTWNEIEPYILILIGILLRTFLPYIRGAVFYMRDHGDWPRFQPKFWIPPTATLIISLIAFGLRAIEDPAILQGLEELHWTALITIGIGGQQAVREIQSWFEQKQVPVEY